MYHYLRGMGLLLVLALSALFAADLAAQSGHTWWTPVLDQSFESGFTAGQNIGTTGGWAVTQPASDTSMYWRVAPYNTVSGTARAANIHWNSTPSSDSDAYTVRLSTPLLSAGANANELYFDYWLDLFAPNTTHTLTVRITFNNWTSSTVIGTISSTTSLTRQTYLCDLAAAGATSSATFKLGFEATGYDTGVNLDGFWLDNVLVFAGSNGSPSSDTYDSSSPYNNTIANATSYTTTSSDTGLTITAGDNDYFTFTTSGGGKVTATFSASGTLSAELYRATGSTYAVSDHLTSFTSSAALEAWFPDPATWLVRVCGATSTSTGTYDIQISYDSAGNDSCEINDSIGTPFNMGGVLGDNVSVLGASDLYTLFGDQDYFTFSSQGGADVLVTADQFNITSQVLKATLWRWNSGTSNWATIATDQVVNGVAYAFHLVDQCPAYTTPPGPVAYDYLVLVETPTQAQSASPNWIQYNLNINPTADTGTSTVTLQSVAAKYCKAGDALSFPLLAIPSNGNHTLRYSKTSGPSGVSVNSVTGVVSWTPTVSDAGVNSVTFFVENWGDDHQYSTTDDSSDGEVVSITVGAYTEEVPVLRSGTSQEPIGGSMSVGKSVDVSTGEFSHSVSLFSIQGRMLPLSMSLTYRSNLAYPGPLGYGWASPAFQMVWYNSSGDTITQFDGSGRIDTFTKQSGGTTGVGPYICTGYALEFWRNNNGTTSTDTDDTLTIKWPDGGSTVFAATILDKNSHRIFKLSSTLDRFGNHVDFIYDAGTGQLIEMRGDLYDSGDPDRYRIQLEYDSLGRLALIRDYADYSAQSSVLGSSYLGNREWELAYDGDGNLAEVRLPKTARYHDDTKGAEATTTFRTRVGFSYTTAHRLEGLFDARQMNASTPVAWLLNGYDSSGRVNSQKVGRSSGSDTTKEHHVIYTAASGGSPATVDTVNAMAYRSRYELDSNRRVTRVLSYTGTWNTSLSSTGGQIRSTDPASVATDYTYDAEYHLATVSYPRGNQTQYLYNTSATSQLERANLLRVLSVPAPAGSGPTVPTDQENGLLTVMTYVSAGSTAFHNFVETVVSPEAFDVPSGWTITSSLPTPNTASSHTTTNYFNMTASSSGPAGTRYKTRDELSNDTMFTYTSAGQLWTTTDPVSVRTEIGYNASGIGKGLPGVLTAGAQSSYPITTELTYDSLGHVIETLDARANTWKTYWNQLDQVVRAETPSVTGPGVPYWATTSYDLNGNANSTERCNITESGSTGDDGYGTSVSSISSTVTFNQLDLAVDATDVSNVSAQATTTTLTYDNLFRRIETTLPAGNKSGVDYDELGRAIKHYWGYDGTNVSKSGALVQSENYYDYNSNMVDARDGKGLSHTVAYDGYDRPAVATSPSVSGRTWFVTRDYDHMSRAWQVKAWTTNGTTNVLNSHTVSEFDVAGRVTLARRKAVDSLGSNLGYSSYENTTNDPMAGWSVTQFAYRQNGQIDTVTDDLGYTRTIAYDDFNRVASVMDSRDATSTTLCNSDSYEYDASSNLTATIAHMVDDVGNSTRDIRTDFEYDEIGRRVKTRAPELETSVTRLEQTWKYDSRSNVTTATDRMGTNRRFAYDLLDRAIRSKIEGITFKDINTSSKIVSDTGGDIESRTYYDKNSNPVKSVDPHGNTTETRYDLAHRWLQTRMADAVSGTTPRTRTAGSGHTVTQVGSTVFWSKSGAYDDNSNLLGLTDPNSTEVSYGYDTCNRLLSESANTSSNTFNPVGEDGLTYDYDLAGRVATAKTYEGSTVRTQLDSTWDSLGNLELDTSMVCDPLTSTNYTESIYSNWDESGRRYQREIAGESLKTEWLFDRLHRPKSTLVSQSKPGYTSPFGALPSVGSATGVIATYDYLGGGFLHSRQTHYHPDDSARPVVSTFDHDNWMRVTKVRHVRKDSLVTAWPGTTSGDRLLAGYEYRYNANSMMEYEGYWLGADADGGQTDPTGANLFYHDERNLLTKVIYNAAVSGVNYGSASNAAASAAVAAYGADNDLTHTDRVIYDIRNTGTRRSVNWYRAPGSSGSFPDSSTPAHVNTSYDTGEMQGPGASITEKDPGEGKAGEYQQIGYPSNYTYDLNKNVLSDPLRTMKYNYRNELRSVSRKSDDDGNGHGTLVQYRHDAAGRQAWAKRYWLCGRDESLDTRIPLDLAIGGMKLYDGGINNFDPSYSSAAIDECSWPGRLERPGLGDHHYYDFQVYIPESGNGLTGDSYLGYVSYNDIVVHFFTDHTCTTRTRSDASPSALGYQAMAGSGVVGSGWHSIGIELQGSSQPVNIWCDGAQILNSYGNPEIDAKAYFGCQRSVYLLGSMAVNHFASYRIGCNNGSESRYDPDPITQVTHRDGPAPAAVYERSEAVPTMDAAYLQYGDVSMGGTTGITYANSGPGSDLQTFFALPNGRRTLGIVAAATVSDGSGPGPNGESVGVAIVNLPDVTGSPDLYRPRGMSSGALLMGGVDSFNWQDDPGASDTSVIPFTGTLCLATNFGGDGDGNGAGTGGDVTVLALDPNTAGSGNPLKGTTGEIGSDCICRGDPVNDQDINTASTDESTKMQASDTGAFADTKADVMYCADGEGKTADAAVETRGADASASGSLVGANGETLSADTLKQIHAGTLKQDIYYETIDEKGNHYRQKVKDPTLGANTPNGTPGIDFGKKGENLGEKQLVDDCDTGKRALDAVQGVLNILSFLPVIGTWASIANAVVALARGDFAGAALNALGAIPGLKGAASLIKEVKAAKTAGAAAKLVGKAFAAEAKAMIPGCGGGALKKELAEAGEAIEKAEVKSLEEGVAAAGCFAEGTLVATAEGERTIEEMRPGDIVWSFCTADGEWYLTSVAEVYRRWYEGVIVELGADGTTILATAEHPFWVVAGLSLASRPVPHALRSARSSSNAEIGRWVEADDLLPGDQLLGLRGQVLTVASVRTESQRRWVYNLNVPASRTFGVTASGVVVHNACTPTRTIGGKIQKQMPDRGWTEADVDSVLNSPTHTSAATNKANGNAATAYYGKGGPGDYVVRDNVTGEIIQVGGRNDAGWIPDKSIVTPKPAAPTAPPAAPPTAGGSTP